MADGDFPHLRQIIFNGESSLCRQQLAILVPGMNMRKEVSVRHVHRVLQDRRSRKIVGRRTVRVALRVALSVTRIPPRDVAAVSRASCATRLKSRNARRPVTRCVVVPTGKITCKINEQSYDSNNRPFPSSLALLKRAYLQREIVVMAISSTFNMNEGWNEFKNSLLNGFFKLFSWRALPKVHQRISHVTLGSVRQLNWIV